MFSLNYFQVTFVLDYTPKFIVPPIVYEKVIDDANIFDDGNILTNIFDDANILTKINFLQVAAYIFFMWLFTRPILRMGRVYKSKWTVFVRHHSNFSTEGPFKSLGRMFRPYKPYIF